ncbi:hypothetical protein [Nonomuraea sp. NPDC005501]|uniref:hypothetical protein n=1 Tax=Nonomuraea sp. NPDC005501 TaxID=3156884 RepID=UPI0033A98441
MTCDSRPVAVNGKALRGARLAEHGTVHLLAAFDHQSGLVPAQADVAGTTNEPHEDRLRERASAFMVGRNGWMRITVRLWNTLHGAHLEGCWGNLLGKIQEMEPNILLLQDCRGRPADDRNRPSKRNTTWT